MSWNLNQEIFPSSYVVTGSQTQWHMHTCTPCPDSGLWVISLCHLQIRVAHIGPAIITALSLLLQLNASWRCAQQKSSKPWWTENKQTKYFCVLKLQFCNIQGFIQSMICVLWQFLKLPSQSVIRNIWLTLQLHCHNQHHRLFFFSVFLPKLILDYPQSLLFTSDLTYCASLGFFLLI